MKYPRDRDYVKTALNKDILSAWTPSTTRKRVIFWVLCGRGGLSSSVYCIECILYTRDFLSYLRV